jgi:hypothetical protein
MALEAMPVPPRNGAPLTDVNCSVSGGVVSCQGRNQSGNRLRVRFKIVGYGNYTGGLKPICPTPKHPNRAPNVFCAV